MQLNAIAKEQKMTEFVIEEKTEYQENVMRFSDGEVFFFGGESFSGYSHTFSKKNTKLLYEAMKQYYEKEVL